MRWVRKTRHWVTARLSEGAVACTPWLTHESIDALEAAMVWGGPRLPLLSGMVARNLHAAGLYSPASHQAFFRAAAGQLASWLHIFRYVERPERWADGLPGALAEIVDDRVQVGPSIEVLKQAAAAGRGVVLMTIHVMPVLFMLIRLNREVPLTILARYAKDPRRRRLRQRLWRATGISHVSLRRGAQQRGVRLAAMVDELRAGRVVLITPDLARKRDEGRPVRLFGREMHLPSGAAVLSVLSGAPLVMMTGEPAGHAMRLRFHGPFVGTVESDGEEGREAAIAERLQWFADGLEAFLRTHAHLWFFWGDKRWTRVLRSDPRYVRPLTAADDREGD